jgi:hypothetical protein
MSELDTQDLMDPVEEPDLRPERVQNEEAAQRALKAGAGWHWNANGSAGPGVSAARADLGAALAAAERVSQRLQKMPGWSLATGGHAIDRVRSLPSAFGAADYATLVLREAARTRQKVRIGLNGNQVVVSVMAPRQGGEQSMIGEAQLAFASSLV